MARQSYNPNSMDLVRPAQGAIAITAGSSDLSTEIRGLYVGVTGNVTVTHPDGTSVQYVGLAAGVIHPISATKVTAATATSIVGVY